MIGRMIRWMLDHVRARQRKIDIEILWPSCVETAGGDLSLARRMFTMHAQRDPAWRCLGATGMLQRIDELR